MQKLVAARHAADVAGTTTLVIARTDANAADLLTSDCDPYDKDFIQGERTPEGFYRVRAGIDQAISRGLAYAPYADLIWCETATPCLEEARKFAEAIHAEYPDQLLAYNCSPSFNWEKNLDAETIAKFQQELANMGYKYQFITLAGIHNMWFNMFELAHAYAQGEGMRHYVEKVQRPEFEAAEKAIERRNILAPTKGEVVKLFRQQGEWVNPGDPILRLVRLDTLYVEGEIDVKKFEPSQILGCRVTVDVVAGGGRSEKAEG